MHAVYRLPSLSRSLCRVKQYESKLAALNAINSALQKENDKLRAELAEAQDPTTDAGVCVCAAWSYGPRKALTRWQAGLAAQYALAPAWVRPCEDGLKPHIITRSLAYGFGIVPCGCTTIRRLVVIRMHPYHGTACARGQRVRNSWALLVSLTIMPLLTIALYSWCRGGALGAQRGICKAVGRRRCNYPGPEGVLVGCVSAWFGVWGRRRLPLIGD